MQKLKNNKWVEFSSPITLGFAFLALAATLLGALTGNASTRLFFSVYRSPMMSLFFWPRLLLHVLGHADLAHFAGNISLILVLGPIVEKHYGSRRLLRGHMRTYNPLTEAAQLRVAPSVQASAILELPATTLVEVLERSGGWERVAVRGHRGWLPSGVIGN